MKNGEKLMAGFLIAVFIVSLFYIDNQFNQMRTKITDIRVRQEQFAKSMPWPRPVPKHTPTCYVVDVCDSGWALIDLDDPCVQHMWGQTYRVRIAKRDIKQ